MISLPNTATVGIVAAAIAGLVGAAAGYRYADAQGIAALERVQRAEANKRAAVVEAAATRLIAANRQADELTERVAAADAARDTAAQERDRALKSLTTGRACLDGNVVRLLNQPTGARVGQLPAAADEPADGAAGAATDTDVAGWIGDARDAYDACRGRIDALREWRNTQAGVIDER
ncbi:hypothetical protein [Rhodocyclus tenuis]|uniref:Uncharacterized protein n=1 Tax=Rhodocyclus tenuis TaxID=1066 RepID=A0A840G1T8_RHOTE|nr:hypothetical protein [Rhodocyclus tenuis]MBB4248367.1 hypothetical protein [Rhodocyclus tenuis]